MPISRHLEKGNISSVHAYPTPSPNPRYAEGGAPSLSGMNAGTFANLSLKMWHLEEFNGRPNISPGTRI